MSAKIDMFREAGLIEQFTVKYVDYRFLKKISERILSPLSFTNLSGVFNVWAYGSAASIVILVIESLMNWYQKRYANKKEIGSKTKE